MTAGFQHEKFFINKMDTLRNLFDHKKSKNVEIRFDYSYFECTRRNTSKNVIGNFNSEILG